MIVSDLSEQPCNKSDNINKVVTSCSQLVPNLLTTGDKQYEYNLLTACWQTCYKMLDFSVCTLNSRVIVFCSMPLVFPKSGVLRTVIGAASWRSVILKG
jgi:hypothetical protein